MATPGFLMTVAAWHYDLPAGSELSCAQRMHMVRSLPPADPNASMGHC